MSAEKASAPADEEQAETKKVTVFSVSVAVGVVLLIQALSLGITEENLPVYTTLQENNTYGYAPLGTSAPASIGNSLILVAAILVTTFGMVWILRRRMTLSFKTLIFASVSLSAFLLTFITVDGVIANYVSLSDQIPLSAAAGIVPVVLIGYTIFVKNYTIISTTVLGFIAAEVGSFFASSIPLYTALVLPIAFALYDIYAVFRGPLKQLISISPTVALTGMSVKASEFTLGLGDLVFYSMLPALALFYERAIVSLYVIVAVDAGVAVTLYLLTKKRLLPGLPIPMLLGVIVLAAFVL